MVKNLHSAMLSFIRSRAFRFNLLSLALNICSKHWHDSGCHLGHKPKRQEITSSARARVCRVFAEERISYKMLAEESSGLTLLARHVLVEAKRPKQPSATSSDGGSI
jgi:hypothetical protein